MPKDDLGPISFKWHFERGLLKPRMSGHELAAFVLEHMASILSLGLLAGHERIRQEFEAMLVNMATYKEEEQVSYWTEPPTQGGYGVDRDISYKYPTAYKTTHIKRWWEVKNTQQLDKLLPWIRCIYQEEEDDIIHMSLFDKTPQPEGPKYFIMGVK